MTRSILVMGLSALALSVGPAQAQDCALKQLASLDLSPVAGGARMLAPIDIDGRTERFLVATSAGGTSMTAASAKALGLKTATSEWTRLLDAKGNASLRYIHVASLGIGPVLHASNIPMMLTPDPAAGDDPPLDGILAADMMRYYDIEIDFPGRKLNYFAQAHCPGAAVYWPAAEIGVVPFATMDRGAKQQGGVGSLVQHMSLNPDGSFGDIQLESNGTTIYGIDVRMVVELDGKKFTANIDTGSEVSTLNSATARAIFDVTASSPGSAPVQRRAANGDNGSLGELVVVTGSRSFEHVFNTLSFGDVTVTNPHFIVGPQLMGLRDPYNDIVTGSHLLKTDNGVETDMTIGMNILKNFHLYFAFGDRKLYVTEAGPPPVQTGAR